MTSGGTGRVAQRIFRRKGGKNCWISSIRTVTRMRVILIVCLVLCPLCFLLVAESLPGRSLNNFLAAWIAAGFVLLVPLSHLFAELVALRTVRELNGLCELMKEGNLTPFSSPPPEPEGKDPLQTLRYNLFWIGHIIDSRQQALNGAMQNLRAARARLVESIEYASLIQNAFLPRQEEFNAVFPEHFLLWEQRDTVGGDAYWVKRVAGGFFVAVLDCTGHGVPGAFMTLIVHSLFERQDVESMRGDPAGVLTAMNIAIRGALAQDRESALSDDGMDCAMVFVDTERRALHFAGAHSSLFVQDAAGEVREIRGSRHGVGYVRTPPDTAFINHVLSLDQGARYYCLTDGLVDQVGGPLRFPFGKRRFCEFLKAHRDVPLARQKALLASTLREYMGREERRDDVTVLGFSL